jgi:hypothetical protein
MGRFNWVYLAAAVPFLIFALSGSEYGAFWIYIAPAALCVVQFFIPTRLAWFLVTALYAAGAAIYTWLLFADLWRVFIARTSAAVFLDPDDAIAFFVMLALWYLFLVALTASSPWSRRTKGGRSLSQTSVGRAT